MKMCTEEIKELVELEIRELLESYDYPGDLPVIKGSARLALEEVEFSKMGTGSVQELMSIVDTYIQEPIRQKDAPFFYLLKVY